MHLTICNIIQLYNRIKLITKINIPYPHEDMVIIISFLFTDQYLAMSLDYFDRLKNRGVDVPYFPIK